MLPTARALELTFQGRETAIEDQLKIAKLSLCQSDGGKLLGFLGQLTLPGSVARQQILKDTAMGRVGHLEYVWFERYAVATRTGRQQTHLTIRRMGTIEEKRRRTRRSQSKVTSERFLPSLKLAEYRLRRGPFT